MIGDQFRLVGNTNGKYGITNGDIYNFDEEGFMMGDFLIETVVTVSERRNRPKQAPPGDRGWTTVIQGINAIPLLIIFAGKNHLSPCKEEGVPSTLGNQSH